MNIIVTGSTKGIGKAITDIFAPLASSIFLTSRTKEDLDNQRAELNKTYPSIQVYTFPADFRVQEEIKAFGDFVLSNTNNIDVLVNNAGVFRPGNILDEVEADHHLMMSVNLLSVYVLTRIIAPIMKSRRHGHIFNICSVAGLKAYPNGGSYSISKFALYGLTQNLREELKNFDVKVTAVIPGATWSDSWAGVELPLDRLMNAIDVAKTMLNAYQLSPSACVEEIVIRPQEGDL